MLGVPVDELLQAAAVATPSEGRDAAAEVQASQLAPYANVIAMLRDIYEGNQAHVRGWLETPQRELGGSTPLAVLLTPGGAAGVEQFVSGAWLGEPD